MNKIKDKIVTSKCQFGFKLGHSKPLCTAVLHQTIEYYSNVYLLFLDASKAFDRVRHSKLFECLIKKGVCPLYIRIIFVMYELNNAVIKWKQNKSDSFKLNNGVKQGGILSPYLFSVYIDPLLNSINGSSFGCHVGSEPCNVFSFADDVVLLSPTLTGLNRLIDICQVYANTFSVKFNPSKSKLMYFNNCNIKVNPRVKINDVEIQVVDNIKYLGFSITNNIKKFYSTQDTINDIKMRCNVILNNFSCIDTVAKINVYNSQCLSLYGSCLWDLRSKEVSDLEVAWRKSSRRILGLSNRTHCEFIPHLMNTNDIKTIIEQRIINLYIDGIHHDNNLISHVFRNSLLTSMSFYMKNLNIILYKHKLKFEDFFCSCRRMKFKQKLPEQVWKIGLIKQLIYDRDFNHNEILNKQEISDILNFLCTD